MTTLTWELEGEGYDSLHVDDMGDGCIILSQTVEDTGRMERVAISWGQLQGVLKALAPRYGVEIASSAFVG